MTRRLRSDARPAPGDFRTSAARMSRKALRKHYGVSWRAVDRWLAEAGISAAGIRSDRKPVPADFAAMAAQMITRDLLRHYGVSATVLQRWVAESGAEPQQAHFGRPSSKATVRPAPVLSRSPAAAIRIGDVLPCPEPVDRQLVAIVNSRRGQLRRAEETGRVNQQTNQARLILELQRGQAERAVDPVEQAKTFLRRKGYNVYCGTVRGFRKGLVFVGTALLTKRELFAKAEAKGWRA